MASPPARWATCCGSFEPGPLSAARLLAESPVGILLLDTNGVVRDANPAAARLFDVTPDDLVGRELAERADPHAPEVLRDHLASVLGVGRDETEWLATHASGAVMPLALTSTLVHTNDESFVLMHLVDVSECYHHAERMAWSERIQRAIHRDEFVLQLQPILDVRTGRITSAEALIRLGDGDDLVMPDRFLDIAERTGEIIDIDRWVIDHSISLLADIQRAHPGFQLEVNLSGKSIGSQVIETAITDSLLRYGADPQGLVLEITETAAVAHIQTARTFAERQRRLGCRFALDDFGAGFGSFYYLKHLPIDYVKIDGEYVANCPDSDTDRTIVGSIVGIARGLGKRTIAEHVSSAAILEVIEAEGVDFAQGYQIGAPVSVEHLMEMLTFQPPIVRRAAEPLPLVDPFGGMPVRQRRGPLRSI